MLTLDLDISRLTEDEQEEFQNYISKALANCKPVSVTPCPKEGSLIVELGTSCKNDLELSFDKWWGTKQDCALKWWKFGG